MLGELREIGEVGGGGDGDGDGAVMKVWRYGWVLIGLQKRGLLHIALGMGQFIGVYWRLRDTRYTILISLTNMRIFILPPFLISVD